MQVDIPWPGTLVDVFPFHAITLVSESSGCRTGRRCGRWGRLAVRLDKFVVRDVANHGHQDDDDQNQNDLVLDCLHCHAPQNRARLFGRLCGVSWGLDPVGVHLRACRVVAFLTVRMSDSLRLCPSISPQKV